MRKDSIYIDGVDAFNEYGIFALEDCLAGVVQQPVFKEIKKTEWDEYDGEEVDLTAPVLQEKTFNIELGIGNVRYVEDFFHDLSEGAYHTFCFKDIERTLKLRMQQNQNFNAGPDRLGIFSVTFVDDFPSIESAECYALGQTDVWQRGYMIDGIDLSRFGVWALDGSDDNIRKASAVRDNLKIDSPTLSGVIYDDAIVRFKSRDVALNLFIYCDSIAEFWRRYNSLYSVLIKPECRVFHFYKLNKDFECYYKNNSVTKFTKTRSGKIWCQFTLTLSFISDKPVSQYTLLSIESGELVATEDTTSAVIKIRPNI